MFQCDKGGMHKLVVIMSPATGDSQSLAAKGNCILVPQGTPCSLLYGAPCPMVVSIVSKEGQSNVEIGGAKALGADCEFMCPMGGKLTAQSHGQAIATHNEASKGLQIASLIIDLVPIASTIKSIIEVVTGVDPITGEATSRLMAAAGIVPGGKAITKGGKVIKAIVKAEKGAAKTVKAAKTAAKTEKVAASSAKAASKGEKAAVKNAHPPKAAETPPPSPNKVEHTKPAANENNFHPKPANDNTPPATSNTQHERYKAQLRKEMEKPHVEDPKLKKIMDKNYRDNATVGSGSTADAIRQEIKTGQPVKGKMHSQKGEETMNSLADWMKKNQANDNNINPYDVNVTRSRPSDVDAAKNVYLDLKDALGK